MMNTVPIRNAFEKEGFSWYEAGRDIGTDKYYAAPDDAIYRLDGESVRTLNAAVTRVFEEVTGGRYRDISKEDWFLEYFESNDRELIFRKGRIEDWDMFPNNQDFRLPQVSHNGGTGKELIVNLLSNPPPKDTSFKISVYPSQDFVELYLACLGKAQEVYGVSRGGMFRYKSIRTGEEVDIPLVPRAEEEQVFFPVVEMVEPRLKVDGEKVFMLPPAERQAILQMIAKDIREFGACYDWTTNWTDGDVWVNKYNNFFRRKSFTAIPGGKP